MTAREPRPALAGGVAVTPRPLQAYRDMFLLTDEELVGGPILDCPAGASPFGAHVRARGGRVVSVDPAFASPAALAARVFADLDRVVGWHEVHPEGFDWSSLGSPDAVRRLWSEAVEAFAADFALDGSRYVAAALPTLPFPDDTFALTVSGFLLFRPELPDPDDHRDALLELTRVTRGEVRVYPLHDTTGVPWPGLADLRAVLRERGVATEVRPTGCCSSSRPGNDGLLVCRKERGN